MLEFLKNLIPGKPFALYITDEFIQALQLDGRPEAPQVLAIGEKRFNAGVVKDGEILQEQPLSEGIKRFLAEIKPNPIISKKCFVAFQESQSYEYLFHLPLALKGKEFDAELERLVGETIPVPLHEIKYDYHVSSHVDKQIVFVVAVRRLIIDQYYEVIKNSCGLKPVFLEPESLSLLRNIPLNFDKVKNFFLINIRGGFITWFSFLGKDVVDSNMIALNKFKEKPDLLLEDLKKSKEAFVSVVGTEMTHVLVSGDIDGVGKSMKELLGPGLSLSVAFVEKYRFLPDGEDASKFNVISGLALKSLGFDMEIKINLLAK
ncbi:MAG: pilus assembly protein PilM [Candidatus Peregrinibacteria bacterium]|nr:pilus assembly protein PilM [Candidatus Peregrinibacteria bacterium]MDZ4244397.1 pilus assembly protein PilM [Candidatus Gracilibacteria bacterium]